MNKRLYLLLLILSILSPTVIHGQLYTENFDSYSVGDYISVVGAPAWVTWNAGSEGTEQDAQITDEAALSGTQSLKIFGNVPGGPMDVVLVAGLEGAYEFTFKVMVPQGNSGYYNFQENQVPGTGWAFECILNADGTISYNVDGTSFASSTFDPGVWLKVTHLIDTDSDLMNLYLDDVFLAQLPYDGAPIGGLNLYSAGDQSTIPTYYIDVCWLMSLILSRSGRRRGVRMRRRATTIPVHRWTTVCAITLASGAQMPRRAITTRMQRWTMGRVRISPRHATIWEPRNGMTLTWGCLPTNHLFLFKGSQRPMIWC